jgi:hypothetical protein
MSDVSSPVAPNLVTGKQKGNVVKPNLSYGHRSRRISVYVRRLGAVLAAGICAAVVAAPASAAVTWKTPATPFVDGGGGLTIQESVLRAAAMDPGGDSAAIGALGSGFPNDLTQVTARPAGGSFVTSQQLLAPSFTHSEPLALGVDDGGNAHAITFDTDATMPADNRLHEWVLPAGTSTWQTPLTVSSQPPDSPSTTLAAISGGGDELAVWRTGSNPNFQLRFATRSPGGSWSAAADVTGAAGNIVADRAAIDSGGDLIVGYRNVGTHQALAAFKSGSSTTWDARGISVTTGTTDVEGVVVGIDESGDAVAAWERQVTGGTWSTQVATRPFATATWSSAVDLQTGLAAPPLPRLAVNRAGAAAVSWESGTSPAATTRSGPTASFDPANVFASTGVSPNVAIDADGTAKVVWVDSSNVLHGAQHASGGSWSVLPAGPSAVSGTPALALDAAGDGLAVFMDASQRFVSALGLDAAGPLLSGATLPATAAQGASVPFAASPTDVWSAIATVSWDFGDGSSPFTGTTGSHTYAAAGTFTPSLSATDAVGNASSRIFTITISPSSPEGASTPTPGPSPQPTPSPQLGALPKVKLPRLVLISLRTGKGTISASCAAATSDRCSVNGTLHSIRRSASSATRRIKIGSFSGSLAGGRRGVISFKLTKSGLRLLKGKRTLTAAVAGTSRSRSGRTVRLTGSIRVKAKKR